MDKFFCIDRAYGEDTMDNFFKIGSLLPYKLLKVHWPLEKISRKSSPHPRPRAYVTVVGFLLP